MATRGTCTTRSGQCSSAPRKIAALCPATSSPRHGRRAPSPRPSAKAIPRCAAGDTVEIEVGIGTLRNTLAPPRSVQQPLRFTAPSARPPPEPLSAEKLSACANGPLRSRPSTSHTEHEDRATSRGGSLPGIFAYIQPGRKQFPQQYGVSGSAGVVSVDTTSTEQRTRAYLEVLKRDQYPGANALIASPSFPTPQLPAAGDHHRSPALPRGDPQHPFPPPAGLWSASSGATSALSRHSSRSTTTSPSGSTITRRAARCPPGAHHERCDRLDSRSFSPLRRSPVRRRHALTCRWARSAAPARWVARSFNRVTLLPGHGPSPAATNRRRRNLPSLRAGYRRVESGLVTAGARRAPISDALRAFRRSGSSATCTVLTPNSMAPSQARQSTPAQH